MTTSIAVVQQFLRSGFEPFLQGVIRRSRFLSAFSSFSPILDPHSTLRLSFSTSSVEFLLQGKGWSVTLIHNWRGKGTEAEITVPAEACLRALRATSSDLIKLSVWPDRIRFTPFETCRTLFGEAEGAAWAEIASISEQPEMTAQDFGDAFTISAKSLYEMLRFVSCAVGKDSEKQKYRLNTMCLEIVQNCLRLTATDAYRIHRAEVRAATSISFKRLLSGELANCLMKLVAGSELDTIRVALASERLRFRIGNTQLTLRPVDAEIPPYKRGIPKLQDNPVVVERSDLLRALHRASELAKDKVVTLEASPKALSISGGQDGQFLSYVSLPLIHDHPATAVRVNADFAIDAVERFTSSCLEILFPEFDQPLVIRTARASEEGCSQTAVITPFI